jgi:Kef-type K+ transport system membrane component KefB
LNETARFHKPAQWHGARAAEVAYDPEPTAMSIGQPVFWLMLAAVAAPLLSRVPLGFKVPVVVLEVLLGILIGPHVLKLVQLNGILEAMFTLGMAATLFMAGIELDFTAMKGRPLALALGGWGVSVLVGLGAIGLLHIIPAVDAPMIVTLAVCTTALGMLIPILGDIGEGGTPFGRLLFPVGTVGELAPVIAMSLLLSRQYTTWQEFGFLLAFFAIVGTATAVGIGGWHPHVLAVFRGVGKSTQLPVRVTILVLAGLFVLAEEFGFESIFGAFAAGIIIGQATRDSDSKPLRDKLDALMFGWFYPFFFVGTGIKFDLTALRQDLETALLVPTFVLLFLVVRGVPAVLYRKDLATGQRLPFALASAIPSLAIIVVITNIGLKTRTMNAEIAAALVGAALVSALLFPTIAGILLSRHRVQIAASGGLAGDPEA